MKARELVERLERFGLDNDVAVADAEDPNFFHTVFNTEEVKIPDLEQKLTVIITHLEYLDPQ